MKRWKIISPPVIMLACGFFVARALCAADWKDKAEGEEKVVFYTTATTSDTKAMADSFKKLYPKIDVQFDRTSDSQLMERFSTRLGPASRFGTWCQRRDSMVTC